MSRRWNVKTSSCRHWREEVKLPHGFGDQNAAGHSHVQRAQPRPQRDRQPRIGRFMNMVGHARALAAEQEDVTGREPEMVMRDIGSRGREHQPMAVRSPPLLEMAEGEMPFEPEGMKVVEPRAPQVAVARVKSGRFDQVQGQAEASAEAHQRAGILGNVGFVEREPQRSLRFGGGWRAKGEDIDHGLARKAWGWGMDKWLAECHGATDF